MYTTVSIDNINMMFRTLFLVVLGASLASAMTIMPKPNIRSVCLAVVDFVAAVDDHFLEPNEKMRSSSLVVEGGGNAADSACAIGR
jgi:hypothetical protein